MSGARGKVTPKKRGRPATGRDPNYSIRIPAELMQEANEWAKARGLTRSYAIRRWIENGVMDKWKPPKSWKPG